MTVRINPGGDGFTGTAIDSWFTDPWHGAVLDVANSLLLLAIAGLLVRFARSWAVLLTGVTALSGWASNLADRLGLHYWTAPGSMRGAVDFIPIGQHYYNVADLVIIAATSALAITLIATRPRPARVLSPRPWRAGPWALGLGLTTCLVTVLAWHGAVDYGWLSVSKQVINAGS